jgi:hypothetical protein
MLRYLLSLGIEVSQGDEEGRRAPYGPVLTASRQASPTWRLG